MHLQTASFGDAFARAPARLRACPPEDCGGPDGYAQLLQVLADKSNAKHAEMQRWVGREVDPERFDVTAVNKKLATLSRRTRRRRTSTV